MIGHSEKERRLCQSTYKKQEAECKWRQKYEYSETVLWCELFVAYFG